MRLIDADKECKVLADRAMEQAGDKERFLQIMYAQSFLECCKTVDAVPVIRCKNCLHRFLTETLEGKPRYLCKLTRGVVEENDFCSKAKKISKRIVNEEETK